MTPAAARLTFAAHLKGLRDSAGFTQEELATIAGLSVHAISALERGNRKRPQIDTLRALAAALDLSGPARESFIASARQSTSEAVADELSGTGLPLAPTTLLGRERDVDILLQWLGDSAVRLITLTGPGGVGKTRLALEVAREIEGGETRVAFVPLATLRDPQFVRSSIAEALGASEVGAGDLIPRIRRACSDTPTLAVVDNFEHVLDAAPAIAELLTSIASLRMLVTSRAALRVRGEREYAVGPLAVELELTNAASSPALQLFTERVRDVQPDFRLTDANAATAIAICRRLDALPLAIELAAPWLKMLPIDELLRRFDRGGLTSTMGHRDLPERQRTMDATVDWSYRLLDRNQQHLFRRLGVLRGPFSIEAAASVANSGANALDDDAVLNAAAELLDKSLLTRAEVGASTRPLYLMLETVRDFATRQLGTAERDSALEGLTQYCLAESSLAGVGLVDAAQPIWLDRVRDDLENYREVLGWLIAQQRSAEAAEIAYGIMWFWIIRGHATEGLQWFEDILRLPLDGAITALKARLGVALMRYVSGALDAARADLTHVLTMAAAAHDAEMSTHAQLLLGHVELLAGRRESARTWFVESLPGLRVASFPWGRGSALTGLAWVALSEGDDRDAERLLDEAASAHVGSGPWFLLLIDYLRASIAVRRNDPRAAIAAARQGLTLVRQLKERFAFLYTLVPLAAAARLLGDHAWVARIVGARTAVSDRTGAEIIDQYVGRVLKTVEDDARRQLGAERWESEYEAGRRSSIDDLLHEIDVVSV